MEQDLGARPFQNNGPHYTACYQLRCSAILRTVSATKSRETSTSVSAEKRKIKQDLVRPGSYKNIDLHHTAY
jgi:hypothetical protein